MNNFGDLLGPLIVDRMRRRALGDVPEGRDVRLLSVGSVLHFARDGDVVWGSGVNGKVAASEHVASSLDIRAVRGPRTRAFLVERGHLVPEVYGDPGLLVGTLWPELTQVRKRHRLTVVPNLHDAGRLPRRGHQHPRAALPVVLRRIAESDLVVGSSLHGVVVAESLGIPARLVLPSGESLFKYADYYEGTGRPGFRPAATVVEAVALGGEDGPSIDLTTLVDAFPTDLWLSQPNA